MKDTITDVLLSLEFKNFRDELLHNVKILNARLDAIFDRPDGRKIMAEFATWCERRSFGRGAKVLITCNVGGAWLAAATMRDMAAEKALRRCGDHGEALLAVRAVLEQQRRKLDKLTKGAKP